MRYTLLSVPRLSDTELTYDNRLARVLRHPVYSWLGIRPAAGQHTSAEHDALRRWAAGRSSIVEIGVAEGVSALALRDAMAEDGKLYLVDPFHLSRVPALNFMRRTAHRAAATCSRGTVIWLEEFSFDVARRWNTFIDLLLIDGDHSLPGVRRDWEDWSRFVVPGGLAIFHDARLFDGGWTSEGYGPVQFVDEVFRRAQPPDWTIIDEVHSLVVVKRRH